MFSRRPESLRGQLLRWVLIPLIALLVTNAWFSNRAAVAIADQAFDRLLLASAEAIGDDIDVRDGKVVIDLPYASLQLLESNIQERIFYRVMGPDSKTLTGYEDLPAPAMAPAPGQDWLPYSAQYLGETIFLVALSKQLYGTEIAAPLIIIVAETGEARQALSRQILLRALAREGGLIAAAGLLVWLGLVRGLRPLRRLRDSLRSRTPADLSPIDRTGIQTEVRPLIDALNEHTSRIERLQASRQRFIADASHQMRTPLSEMRTQIDYVLRQNRPDLLRQTLEDVHRDIDRLARLIAQLLLHARAEPDAYPGHRMQPVDLARIARSASLDLVSAARNKGMDIGLDTEQEACTVFGNEMLLHELIANLIDNAVSHGPRHGTISVRLAHLGAGVVLEVEDDGPGIAPAERELVFGRFYRGPGSPPGGSGLGLSIARDICTLHGATIELVTPRSGQGLCVRVSFASTLPQPALEAAAT